MRIFRLTDGCHNKKCPYSNNTFIDIFRATPLPTLNECWAMVKCRSECIYECVHLTYYFRVLFAFYCCICSLINLRHTSQSVCWQAGGPSLSISRHLYIHHNLVGCMLHIDVDRRARTSFTQVDMQNIINVNIKGNLHWSFRSNPVHNLQSV